MAERGKKQDCTKRTLIYETWCHTCYLGEEKKIDGEDIEEKEKEMRKKKIKVHKYVGETARSAYERGSL